MISNMEYFTCACIEGEDRARDLQHLLGWSLDQQVINAQSKNFIINFLVLSDGVRRDHAIYGPATTILKKKMMRKKTKNI